MLNPHALCLQHIWIPTTAIILLLTIIFLIWSKHTRTLLWKDFWVVLPFVGKMAHWKKETEGTGDEVSRLPPDAGYVDRTLTQTAERALYNYYNDCLINTPARSDFLNAREYLKISGQNGRKPTSPFVWGFLCVLTVAEALFTAWLLAPLLSNEMTPTQALIGGPVIAFVLGVVAVLLTHGAGEDTFANSLLAKVRNSFKQNKGFRWSDGSKSSDFVQPVGYEDDQRMDSYMAPDARLAARIGATSITSMQPKRMRIIAAVAFVVLFAVGITAYRDYIFATQQDCNATTPFKESGRRLANYSTLFGPRDGTAARPLPTAVRKRVEKSRHRALSAICNDKRYRNDVGIMVLTLIFVFTQILGFFTGFKYSFFNTDAEEAYRITRGHSSYDDFLRAEVQPVTLRAQMRFHQLRSYLSSANPAYGAHMKPFDFMDAHLRQVAERARHAGSPPDAAQAMDAGAAAARPGLWESSANAAPSSTARAPAAVPLGTGDLEEIARAIIGVRDADQRRKTAAELIHRHGLTREQQGKLALIIQKIKDEQDIDPDLLKSL
jgi:hypothetical protein